MSAWTKTNITNLSLREIGTYRINDFDTDTSAEARVARDLWDFVLSVALEAHEWMWATKDAALNKIGAASTRFDFEWQLPSDFVRLGRVSDDSNMLRVLDSQKFAIQDGKIMCSSDAVYISYVYNKSAPGTWPGYFAAYFAAVLAAEMASALKSTTERERLEQLQMKRLAEARTRDSVQTPVQLLQTGNWRQAMRGVRDVPPYLTYR